MGKTKKPVTVEAVVSHRERLYTKFLSKQRSMNKAREAYAKAHSELSQWDAEYGDILKHMEVLENGPDS